MMEEDLVAVRVGRNARYVAVGFAANPFGRMGFLKQLDNVEKKNLTVSDHRTANKRLLNVGKFRLT